MKLISTVVLAVILSGCAGMPDLSLTPVSADLQVGGTREIGSAEDNMAKIEVGTENNSTRITADAVTQVENNIQEYPKWLVIAFAIALGLAIPSPLSAWQSWRRRKYLERQVDQLTTQLYASQPTYTTKPEANPSLDASRLGPLSGTE